MCVCVARDIQECSFGARRRDTRRLPAKGRGGLADSREKKGRARRECSVANLGEISLDLGNRWSQWGNGENVSQYREFLAYGIMTLICSTSCKFRAYFMT